jgi:hypothetical protein
MTRALTRSFYLHLDPELRIVHTRMTCPAAKVAFKYNDLVGVTIKNVEDAQDLDKKGTPCPACLKHEQFLRGKRTHPKHISPPGFRS